MEILNPVQDGGWGIREIVAEVVETHQAAIHFWIKGSQGPLTDFRGDAGSDFGEQILSENDVGHQVTSNFEKKNENEKEIN